MQMPDVSRLFREVVRSEHMMNQRSHAKPFGPYSVPDLSHPSNGVKRLKLRWKKLASQARLAGGAKNLFCRIFGHQKAENTFWLDSSSVEKVCFFLHSVFDLFIPSVSRVIIYSNVLSLLCLIKRKFSIRS